MLIRVGTHTYEWIEDWARLPDLEAAKTGWAHHGMAVTSRNTVVAGHPARADLLEFDAAGKLLSQNATGLTECHGVTLVTEGDTDYFWVVDTGRKYQRELGSPRVVKISLEGKIEAELGRPPHPKSVEGEYVPTWVAVNEERFGGNGDIWVADGYGSSLVHRFDKSGNYVATIDGREGSAGRFQQPHTVFLDTRKSQSELYIADRANHRIQVYDLEGTFKRSFGEDFLTRPTGFGISGEDLVIIELQARTTLVDADDALIGHIGANQLVCESEGWPNSMNEEGEPARSTRLEPGKFNSPHGVAVDRDGNVYITEWLIGGRYIKLEKRAA